MRIGKLSSGLSTAGHGLMAPPPWLTTRKEIKKWHDDMRAGLKAAHEADPLCFNSTERAMRHSNYCLRNSSLASSPEALEARIKKLDPQLRIGHPYADKRDKKQQIWIRVLKESESLFEWWIKWTSPNSATR